MARAHRNDPLRRRHGLFSIAQGEFHAAAHGAGDKQAVRVTPRRDESQTEAAPVPANRAQHGGLGFTSITSAVVHPWQS